MNNPHTARQFSVRDLFTLTLVVSILLTIGVLSHGSEYFGALASPWTAVSLLPIVAVWLADRWQLMPPRAMLVAAVAGYPIALGLPAFAWPGEIVFGWVAWLQSFWGLLLFGDRHVEGSGGLFFGPFTIPLSFPIACAFGAAANLSYFIALAAAWYSRRKPRGLKLAQAAAITAILFAFAALLPMCLTGELVALLPGYGVWTASFLALALACDRRRIVDPILRPLNDVDEIIT
jgi:MFS family permease